MMLNLNVNINYSIGENISRVIFTHSLDQLTSMEYFIQFRFCCSLEPNLAKFIETFIAKKDLKAFC